MCERDRESEFNNASPHAQVEKRLSSDSKSSRTHEFWFPIFWVMLYRNGSCLQWEHRRYLGFLCTRTNVYAHIGILQSHFVIYKRQAIFK
jgi:hypothetical protein